MGKIKFIKSDGNIPVPATGKDHVSGLFCYVPTGGLPPEYAGYGVKKVSSLSEAEDLGIISDDPADLISVLNYHISEYFRIQTSGELWIGLYEQADPVPSNYDFAELEDLIRVAKGAIRQVGVYCPEIELATADVGALQTIASAMGAAEMPVSIVYAANIEDITGITNVMMDGRENVSVVIGQDTDGVAKSLYNYFGPSITILGAVLGALSLASVQESIAWVDKFPMGINAPGFADGTTLDEITAGAQYGSGSLDEMRFIFLKEYTGRAGNYLNDSHNMTILNSDYNYIERVRTMDKAIRGIRYNLQPQINGNVRIDAETGQIAADAVAYYQNLANRALEDMEKAGELSGYVVYIDPTQNVLSTGEMELQIKNVPIGIVRNYTVKIGYAQSV